MSNIILPKDKKLQIKIVTSNNLKDFTDTINDLLLKDWNLDGQMIISDLYYYQRMSKIEEVDF